MSRTIIHNNSNISILILLFINLILINKINTTIINTNNTLYLNNSNITNDNINKRLVDLNNKKDGKYEIISTDMITTGTYYRDQLHTFEKVIYDEIKEKIDDDTYFDFSIYDINNENHYSVSEISKACFRVTSAFIMDNPRYFWISNGSRQSITSNYNTIERINIRFNETYEENQVKKMNEEIDTTVQNILKELKKYTTTLDKVKYIHDYLIKTIQYETTDNCYNLYGALVDKISVCEGYAESFTYLCQLVNVTSIIVNSESHEWNYVQMDNGKWYVIDVTYDDPQIGNMKFESGKDGNKKYDYFLIGKNTYVSNSNNRVQYKNSPDHQILNYLLLENAEGFEYPELADEEYDVGFSRSNFMDQLFFSPKKTYFYAILICVGCLILIIIISYIKSCFNKRRRNKRRRNTIS